MYSNFNTWILGAFTVLYFFALLLYLVLCILGSIWSPFDFFYSVININLFNIFTWQIRSSGILEILPSYYFNLTSVGDFLFIILLSTYFRRSGHWMDNQDNKFQTVTVALNLWIITKNCGPKCPIQSQHQVSLHKQSASQLLVPMSICSVRLIQVVFNSHCYSWS